MMAVTGHAGLRRPSRCLQSLQAAVTVTVQDRFNTVTVLNRDRDLRSRRLDRRPGNLGEAVSDRLGCDWRLDPSLAATSQADAVRILFSKNTFLYVCVNLPLLFFVIIKVHILYINVSSVLLFLLNFT